MEKKTLWLKTKYIVIENENKTAEMIYRAETTAPVKKTVKLNNSDFNSVENREIILKALEEEKIIITHLTPKTFEGKKLIAGVGTKKLVFKKYKTANYKPKENGFSFLETTIVATIIITLGAFMAPNLITLANTAKETHYAAVENENTNMDIYNTIVGAE